MFTLYVYGDVYMFYNVLNAVAMVFNSSMFNPTTGAGAFLVGGLVSVIILTSKTIFHGNADFKPAYLMSLFLFFFAGVNVKTTVQIEDIFTGVVSSVSNVPMFVAAPAGIISAAANGITTRIETAFTVPAPGSSFTSLSLGTEGFENPLKLLMALRCNSGSGLAEKNCPSRSFPYVTRSLQLFLLYCAQPNSNFTPTGFENAPNVVSYLTSLPGISGLTTYYSNSYPQGVGMDCATAASNIQNDVNNLLVSPNSNTINNLIYQNMISTEPGQANPATWGKWGMSDVTNSFNSIMNGSSSQMVAQGAQAYMINQMFEDSLDNTFKCSSSTGTVNDFNVCIEGIMQRDALEKMKVDDSAAGSIFSRTMFPAMNLLLMLFYGFSPLVALVAMMMAGGGQGFKVVGSYFLFGAWVQSWTPVAAIIDYYMQMLAGQAAYAAGLTAPGLTITNEHMFYDALGMKIALGANMLAATPMLTMALISGSMFAMTGTVSAITGKDKTDEGLAAPALAQGNAVTQLGAANQYSARNSADQTDAMGLGAQENKGLDTYKFNLGQANAQQLATSRDRAAQYSEAYANDVMHGLQSATGKSNAFDAGTDWADRTQKSDTNTWSQSEAIANELLKGTDATAAQKKAVTGVISAAIQAKVGGNGLIKLAEDAVGVDAHAKVGGNGLIKLAEDAFGVDAHASVDAKISGTKSSDMITSQKVSQNAKEMLGSDFLKSHMVQHGESSGKSEALRQSLTDGMTKTDGDSWKKNKTMAETWSKRESEAQSRTNDATMTDTYNGFQLATNLVGANPQVTDTVNATMNGLSDKDRQFINTRAKVIEKSFGVSDSSDPAVLHAARVASQAVALMQNGGENAAIVQDALLNAATGRSNLRPAGENGSSEVDGRRSGDGQQIKDGVTTMTANTATAAAPAEELTGVGHHNLKLVDGPHDHASYNPQTTQGTGTPAPITQGKVNAQNQSYIFGEKSVEQQHDNDVDNQPGVKQAEQVIAGAKEFAGGVQNMFMGTGSATQRTIDRYADDLSEHHGSGAVHENPPEQK